MSKNQEAPEKISKVELTFRRILAALISLLVLILIFISLNALKIDQIVEQLELKTYDLRAQIQWDKNKNRPSQDVVILQFDDASLNTLSDDFGVWPWPRDVHARMIKFLNQIGARSLLYDIMFVSPRKGNEAGDAQLVNAFKQYPNVYLSMNLTNDLSESQQLGKDLTPQDIERLQPLSIKVESELNQAPANTPLNLIRDEDGEVFFNNSHMNFNFYRSILPGLLEKKSNIGIINHGSDIDGVSRGNPLFFRFKYYGFIKTQAWPLHLSGKNWRDANNNLVDAGGNLFQKSTFLPVKKQSDGTYRDQNPEAPQQTDAEGYFIDDYKHYIYQRESHTSTLYFPYLGLRIALELKYPHQKLTLHITRNGHLRIKDFDIPLNANGDFLVNWYNINIRREALQLLTLKSAHLATVQDKLEAKLKQSGLPLTEQKKLQTEIAANTNELEIIQEQLKEGGPLLASNYIPQPYQMVSAWQVMRLMKKQKAGLPYTQADLQLINMLKNKIIFIGATAVATYDIKNTAIYSTMPGVILQATLFDNLFQNTGHYLYRSPPNINLMLTILLCMLAAICTLKMRSAIAGLLATANIAIIYILGAIFTFQSFYLWINIAMPMVCLLVTITITFMLKYFFSNQDYEKTYALATTDSMTGLYNHRFFQDQMRNSIEQASRFRHQFSLLLIDIDFFKKFNDAYGHQAGDEVLRQVARKLKKNVRTVDIVARYGGEEMAIILERTTEEEALAVAQKVVNAIADEAYPIAEGVAKHVTISCGVATYPTHGETPSQLIEFADAGLYRAKSNGRNQVGPQYDNPDAPSEPRPVH